MRDRGPWRRMLPCPATAILVACVGMHTITLTATDIEGAASIVLNMQ